MIADLAPLCSLYLPGAASAECRCTEDGGTGETALVVFAWFWLLGAWFFGFFGMFGFFVRLCKL